MLTSPFVLAKHAWPARREAGAGRFVVIASAHTLVASPFKAAYVSAQHGVLGLVKTLALEGTDHGITAAAVCPGYVRTPLVQRQIADQARAHGLPEQEVLESVILAPHAVKSLIEPAEVAGVVAFLAGVRRVRRGSAGPRRSPETPGRRFLSWSAVLSTTPPGPGTNLATMLSRLSYHPPDA